MWWFPNISCSELPRAVSDSHESTPAEISVESLAAFPRNGCARIMNLSDAQQQQVAAWIQQGLKLSEIQSRLAAELGVRLTYMEVRLLVDDLKLTPKDPEPVKPAAIVGQPPPLERGAGHAAKDSPRHPAAPGGNTAPPATSGSVSVTVAEIARPGTVVSGDVIFSDGKRAEWYLDQFGRLAVVPAEPGYKPPPADMPAFQRALEGELAKLGF